jgi:hypothetical protein
VRRIKIEEREKHKQSNIAEQREKCNLKRAFLNCVRAGSKECNVKPFSK